MRACLKHDAAGNSFQLRQIAAQLPMVGDGLLHGLELRGGQSHRDGFSRHFAGPLVTGADGAAGAVLNRALADVACPAQPEAAPLKLPPQFLQRDHFFVHRAPF
jgi:hypothetical protein